MHPAPPQSSTLSLHDALPIYRRRPWHARRGEALVVHRRSDGGQGLRAARKRGRFERPEILDRHRSEEHTSELQSPYDLVCRLLLEKKKKKKKQTKKTNTTYLK